MSPERWRQIEDVYCDALELELTARAAFLDQACAGDDELRREVESLVAAHEQAGHFITTPAMDVVARQMAERHSQGRAQDYAARRAASSTNPFNPTSHDASLGTEAVSALLPGTLLGSRYLVEREIGKGGVGEVYLARDRKLLDAPVVVKVLREQLRDSSHREWFERKFEQEIAALSRIDHPGVVRALDVGELDDGRAYFVMQYVPGVCLRLALEPRGMGLGRAAYLLGQTGHALTAAHRHGVIHRDLKPENIMLQPTGDEEIVKLIDFGIATVLDDANASGITTTTVIGTREYMAPEQLMGRPEAASDTFALGVIAYEMLTGRRPFNPANVAELYEAQRRADFTRPRELRTELPVAAEEAIIKALAFDPGRRYARAKDFTDALARALLSESDASGAEVYAAPSASLPTRPDAAPCRMPVWPAVAAMVVIIAGAGATIWWRIQSRTPEVVTAVEPPAAALPERQLSYSLTARKDPRRHPQGKPFLLPGEIIFEAGYHVRLNLTSPQDGHLYVINEGPARAGSLPDYIILFPEAASESAAIPAGRSVQIPPPSGRPEDDWFVFDEEEGVEKVWLVWAARPVAEFEAVKRRANAQERGVISDPDEIKSVAAYLGRHATMKPEVERDDAHTLTRLKARGEALVGLVRLQHR
jgi:tRNA A-37 threonylcarbamoyl transferase component Bud32